MNEWDYLPAILGSVLIISTAVTILLRPISKQLGFLISEMVAERQNRIEGESMHMRELVERLESRLSLMEEKSEFTEQLLSRGASPKGEDPS